jgi:hypothetical protein
VKILINIFLKKTSTGQLANPSVCHKTGRGEIFNPISLVGAPRSAPFPSLYPTQPNFFLENVMQLDQKSHVIKDEGSKNFYIIFTLTLKILFSHLSFLFLLLFLFYF